MTSTNENDAMQSLCLQIEAALNQKAEVLGRIFQSKKLQSVQVSDAARNIAFQLINGDKRQKAKLSDELEKLLFPNGVAIPRSWWRSPLGKACSLTIGLKGPEAISRLHAAEMLGVTHQRVAALVDVGKLERHPMGGVTRKSLMKRINTKLI